jgi:predicted aspartyl protease
MPTVASTRIARHTVALILALAAAAAIASDPAVAQQPARAPVTIPFELAIRHVIVKARVNGSRPLSFALDTGAGPALVSLKTATELGLSLYGRVNSGGAGPGTQTGQRVKDAAPSRSARQ